MKRESPWRRYSDRAGEERGIFSLLTFYRVSEIMLEVYRQVHAKEGVKLDIGFTVFQTRDIGFLSTYTLCELLLCKSGFESFFL